MYSGVATDNRTAKLYFSMGSGSFDRFAVEYGRTTGGYEYSYDDVAGGNDRTLMVGSLDTGSKYYFRVRAGGGCMPGPWSGEMAVQLPGSGIGGVRITNVSPVVPAATETPMPGGENLISPVPAEQGYDLKVKVDDSRGQPVAGAKVTLHSTPMEATTDTNGIAEFMQVAAGEHLLTIAYGSYNRQQSITVGGMHRS